MNKVGTLILLITLSLTGLSQNTTITGTTNGQPEKLIRIICYADEFSNLEHTIAETQTNSFGEFSLNVEVSQTKFAYIALGLDKGEFYLTPKADYYFNILTDTLSDKGSIFDRLPLNFTVKANDKGIQQDIGDFNIDYNDFVYNNFKSIYKSRDKSVVMQFVTYMQSKYTNDKPGYVKNYVQYTLAQLLWLSKKQNNRLILINYFINQPVLYNNIQYADFFKEFFKSYFTTEKTFTYEELILAINSSKSIQLDTLLERDEQLALDNRVREIAKMLLLSKNYYNRDVNKMQVISKLENIEQSSAFSENKLVAHNFIIKIQELQNGSLAPSFTLTNANNDSISLNDFNGKFVLLSFVKQDCKICNFHMQLLNDIKKQNGNEFDIITIVAGDKLDKFVDFAQSKGWKWPILKSGDNILLLEDYNIRAYPSYILINPDGTIAYAHLPMPNENMELYIQRFMNSYNSTH